MRGGRERGWQKKDGMRGLISEKHQSHGQDECKINSESYVNFTVTYYRPLIWVGFLHKHSLPLSLLCCDHRNDTKYHVNARRHA